MNFGQLLRWTPLVILSVLLSELAGRAGFPAAYLLGPMLCAVGLGLTGIELRLSRPFLSFSQGVIGCLVARSLTRAILVSIAHDWPAMLLVIVTTVIAGGLVGWVLVKLGTLPGTTAAWGSSPGAAPATAAAVSSVPLIPFAETLAIAIGGAAIGRVLKIPAGALLVPMAVGSALHATGLVEITLPLWLLHVAYVLVGWYVGLSFDRLALNSAFKATPTLVLSTLLLIGLCAVSAWLLTRLVGVDLLTAYLATSPGGLDSIAVIATGSRVDVPFVLAIQTMRLFLVLLTGPAIARFISRYA